MKERKKKPKNILYDLVFFRKYIKKQKIVFIFVCIMDLVTSLLRSCGLDLNFKYTEKNNFVYF
jgi:anti-anti-sigma regulatory factor